MTNNNVITNSAEFGLIPQREFFDKNIAVEGNTDKYYIIEQGDFVYNPRKSTTAPYGPFNCYQGEEKGIVSPLYTCLKPLQKEYADYLLWYFRSPAWYSYIYHNGAQGGARHDRVGMTNDLMDGIPVNLPSLEEQEKISRFLATLEKRIEKQRQLVELLKSYKRGALSKLFPQKGETTPQYRFAGFTEPWEQRKLGEMMNVTSVKRIHQSDWTTEGVRFLRARDIVSDFKNETSDDLLYISKEKYEEYSTISGKVDVNDLLVTGVGTIGIPYLVRNLEPLYFKDGNIIWFKNSGKIDGEFLYYSFIGATIQDFINEAAGIGTVGTYTIESGKKTPIFLPSNNEQRQIGNFFKSLDNLITLHQRKLSEFESVKSGLLQQLFI